MEGKKLSRTYLETLPSADLISLADEYGIDIPENLNRRFIIGELLEVEEDFDHRDQDNFSDSVHGVAPVTQLPNTYNETQIYVVLRNPVWICVFWDLKQDDIASIQRSSQFVSLNLRISFFEEKNSDKVLDRFSVPVSLSDRERYILIQPGYKVLRVDLVSELKNGKHELLASSEYILLPHVSEKMVQPLSTEKISPILEQSGLPDLLKTHYLHHRQSFV